jgi:hypothetical protein
MRRRKEKKRRKRLKSQESGKEEGLKYPPGHQLV